MPADEIKMFVKDPADLDLIILPGNAEALPMVRATGEGLMPESKCHGPEYCDGWQPGECDPWPAHGLDHEDLGELARVVANAIADAGWQLLPSHKAGALERVDKQLKQARDILARIDFTLRCDDLTDTKKVESITNITKEFDPRAASLTPNEP